MTGHPKYKMGIFWRWVGERVGGVPLGPFKTSCFRFLFQFVGGGLDFNVTRCLYKLFSYRHLEVYIAKIHPGENTSRTHIYVPVRTQRVVHTFSIGREPIQWFHLSPIGINPILLNLVARACACACDPSQQARRDPGAAIPASTIPAHLSR